MQGPIKLGISLAAGAPALAARPTLAAARHAAAAPAAIFDEDDDGGFDCYPADTCMSLQWVLGDKRRRGSISMELRLPHCRGT